jgi:group I intron endonuclease
MASSAPGIYLIKVNRRNKRCLYYVGQTVDLSRRRSQHFNRLRAGKHFNPRMQKCWAVYGASAFEFEVLESCSAQDLNEREGWWLQQMAGHRCVLNVAINPENSFRGIPKSEAHKARISAALSGPKHYAFGRELTPEHRAKIALGGSGVRRGSDTRAKISRANTGAKNPMHGKLGRLNPRSKPIVAAPISGDGPTLNFESAQQAALRGFQQASISRCCAGKISQHAGYRWSFAVA